MSQAETVNANADRIAAFIADIARGDLPPEALQAAQFCIVDWFGVAIGAANERPVNALRNVVSGWAAVGHARVLLGGTTAAAPAALVNGMMAHCLDFDDTHVGSIAHLSGPSFAAAYAVGMQRRASPRDILKAFVTGFEVAARLGGDGFGVAINERNIHSTGVFGCFGAATAASVLLGLNAQQTASALGLAATQAAGLTYSFGTSGKPFHAGKAAFNGVLAAEMAAQGYDGATDLLEPGGGLGRALVQDGTATIAALDFADGWEITRNTFKPYASCLLTHPVIDAAREIRAQIGNRRVADISVHVEPMAIQLAGKAHPSTPFEGKFSLAFCTALALTGHSASRTDFSPANLGDPVILDLVRRTRLVAVPGMARTAARLEVTVDDGERLQADTALARGNPGRPMGWDDLAAKFTSLVRPFAGSGTGPLFDALRAFGTAADDGDLDRMIARLKAPSGPGATIPAKDAA